MNGMTCPRCGTVVNARAAQCPNCGQGMRPAAPAAVTAASAMLGTTALQQAYDAQKKRNLIIAAVLGVLALVALLVGLKAAGILGASSNNPDAKLLQAKGRSPSQILAVPASTGPQLMEKPAQKPASLQMPDDVYDWLEHLRKCEEMKVQIAGDQSAEVTVWAQKNSVLGAGMGMMNPYDQANGDDKDQAPGSYTKGKILDLRPQWQKLITFFDSKTPPAECKPIADDFDRAINEIPGMMGDIGDVLNTADTDPQGALQKIKKMQNGSYDDIDRYFDRCDQKVSAICAKYNVNKWFNIKGDVLAGGMMGKFGAGLPSGLTGPGG